MLELMQALVTEPVAQHAAASPLVVVNAAFVVSSLQAPFRGNIRVVVQNTGAESDELVAVTTPLGETLEFRTDGNVFSLAEPRPLPIYLASRTGDRPSYLPLIVNVEGMPTGDFWKTGATITLRFARAGEINVTLHQTSPAPQLR